MSIVMAVVDYGPRREKNINRRRAAALKDQAEHRTGRRSAYNRAALRAETRRVVAEHV
jgi:hypothetical protein